MINDVDFICVKTKGEEGRERLREERESNREGGEMGRKKRDKERRGRERWREKEGGGSEFIREGFAHRFLSR